MDIKLAGLASVQPVVGTRVAADVAAEALAITIRRRELQMQLMGMAMTPLCERHEQAQGVVLNLAQVAVIREAGALVSTSSAVKAWSDEEVQVMAGIGWVLDPLGHVEARTVKREGTGSASVVIPASYYLNVAGRAYCSASPTEVSEFQRVLVAEVPENWHCLVVERVHVSLLSFFPLWVCMSVCLMQ